VLPEPKGGKKTAKAESIEAGVNYILQAAAYTNSDDADRLKARLVLNGMEPRIEKITVGDKGTYYRVRLGPYPTSKPRRCQQQTWPAWHQSHAYQGKKTTGHIMRGFSPGLMS